MCSLLIAIQSETELQREAVPVGRELPTIRDTSCEPVSTWLLKHRVTIRTQIEPQMTTVENKPQIEPCPDRVNDDSVAYNN